MIASGVNEDPAQELHKPMIKKFKRRKVYGRFKDNIWAADLAEMGSFTFKIRWVDQGKYFYNNPMQKMVI